MYLAEECLVVRVDVLSFDDVGRVLPLDNRSSCRQHTKMFCGRLANCIITCGQFAFGTRPDLRLPGFDRRGRRTAVRGRTILLPGRSEDHGMPEYPGKAWISDRAADVIASWVLRRKQDAGRADSSRYAQEHVHVHTASEQAHAPWMPQKKRDRCFSYHRRDRHVAEVRLRWR